MDFLQATLTGGELSPALRARVDLARYLTSLKTCRNYIVQPYGGIINRPGFKLVDTLSSPARLIPFQYSASQTYMIAACYGSPAYFYIYSNGGKVLITSRAEWVTATIYRKGTIVQRTLGSPYIYRCLVSHTSGTWATDLAAGYWSYVGIVGQQAVVSTGYAMTQQQMKDMTYAQVFDVISFAHNSFKPFELKRYAHDVWSVEYAIFNKGPYSDLNYDSAVSFTIAYVSGYTYTLTSSDLFSFTSDDVGSMMKIEVQNYTATPWIANTAVAASAICINDFKYYQTTAGGTTGTKAPINDIYAQTWFDGGVTWTYNDDGKGYGYINSVTIGATTVINLTASDSRLLPLLLRSGSTYKWAKAAWSTVNGYPACVGYFQQRRIYAGSLAAPQTVWASRTGNYEDYENSSPIVDDDPVIFTVASNQSNPIRHLVSLDRLLMMTTGGDFVLGTGDTDVLTPTNIGVKQQSYRGVSTVRPIGTGSVILYVEDGGRIVRDLGYDFAQDQYIGNDLTMMADHLFDGKEIVDWTWHQIPYQCVWAVQDDGSLLSMTYMKDQAIVAWAHHDSENCLFKSCACIREDSEDFLYVITTRGATSYLERMEHRYDSDIENAFYVDAGLTYNGWNTAATTVTLSGGNTWDSLDSITITSSAPIFSYPATTDIGDAIAYMDGERLVKVTITGLTSTTVATGTPSTIIDSSRRSTAFTDWGFARNSFSGVGHLNGKTCDILADGNVLAQVTPSGGAFTTSYPHVVVHVGYPIVADAETLEPHFDIGGTSLTKQKAIPQVSLMVRNTRSLWAGRDEDNLYEFKAKPGLTWDSPIQLENGIVQMEIPTNWDKSGQVFIRHADPLPSSILAIIPSISVGG